MEWNKNQVSNWYKLNKILTKWKWKLTLCEMNEMQANFHKIANNSPMMEMRNPKLAWHLQYCIEEW